MNKGKLIIIWDYDSALGQINSSLPYNFSYNQIYDEIKNVDYILEKAKLYNLKMTFACLGFDAEDGIFPFNNPEQIKRIFEEGHEIASHSWRHEWFPHLSQLQVYKSLERSKLALEKCLSAKDAVRGFVPPHSRPMSWYKKFSFSFGDRAIYPFNKGADMGFILNQLELLNYKWCRVLKYYTPVWEKIVNQNGVRDFNFSKWEIHNNVVCVPQHYTGFDEPAIAIVEMAIEKNEAAVIVGHPAALSRNSEESIANFEKFITAVQFRINEGKLETSTVSDFIKNIFPAVIN